MTALADGRYVDLRRSIGDAVGAERVPLSASVEVTRRCSLACGHCYNNLPIGDREARDRELTLDEHRRLIDEMAALGTLWLLYTGGEIFARPDFLDIYAHAVERGFLVTLFTNATMITEEIADRLADRPPFAVEVTLYGHTSDVYERLTNVPGSHARCLRGVRLLLDRGLRLKLKTVAVRTNVHEIDDMRRQAEELGVPFKFDGAITPRLDCSRAPLALRLSPEDLVALDLGDPERARGWRDLAARARPRTGDGAESLYTCGGGQRSFAVDPYGRMSLCVSSQQETYDLRAGSVAEGWEHFLGSVRRRRTSRPTKCTRCALGALCGMCAAMGELEERDPEAPVEFLCETAHLRARALGTAVPEHGACAFCSGGDRHAALETTAARLAAAAPASNAGARRHLPIAPPDVDAGDGGCGSC